MLLCVEGLTKTFKKKSKVSVAVNNVSFTVGSKECLGIIGESGSGKSTTANMIAGFYPPDSGSITFNDTDLLSLSKRKQRELRMDMQMVFQNPAESFNPKIKLLNAIMEPLDIRGGMTSDEKKAKVMEALNMVELKEEYACKYGWQISGGECQRAAIARAIVSRPKLLICDEVTSALDVSVQAQILKLLDNLRETLDMSYIFISHDLASVSSICDRVAVMYKGSVLEYGKTMDIVGTPRHPYTQDLLESVRNPGGQEIFERDEFPPEKGCKYYLNCRIADEECKSFTPEASSEDSYCLCRKQK